MSGFMDKVKNVVHDLDPSTKRTAAQEREGTKHPEAPVETIKDHGASSTQPSTTGASSTPATTSEGMTMASTAPDPASERAKEVTNTHPAAGGPTSAQTAAGTTTGASTATAVPHRGASSSTMAYPSSCRAIVAPDVKQKLQIKEVQLSAPVEGHILVKVEACGICFSDYAVCQGEFGPLSKKDLIPGHEIIGRVVAVGPGVKKWKEGDRVGGGWHGGHDGTCRSCNRGLFQICDNAAVNGVSRDGGYAEYCTLRAEAGVRIPKDMDAAQAAPLLCAGVTVFNGIRNMNIPAGGTVAIQGLGGLGHLALQYSRKMGYRTVALSRDATKKNFATKLGATDYLDGTQGDSGEALQKLGGADLIVVTAPNPKVMSPLINGLAPRGKILILAPVGEVPFNTVPMVLKGQSVHGWPSGHALDSEEALEFARIHGVECMIEKFSMDQINEAHEHMVGGKVRFRGVLVM